MIRTLQLALAVVVGLVLYDVATTSLRTPEWEYLVLSPGTLYVEAVEDARVEERAKFEQAFPDGAGYGRPVRIAAFTQQLDALGAQGWELVHGVGQVGSDQQLVFKRRKSQGFGLQFAPAGER